MRIREKNPLFPEVSLPDVEHWQEEKNPEKLAPKILHEVLETAGHHTLEESTALLQERLAAIQRKKISGERRLSETERITDIKPRDDGDKETKISEGAITYLKVEQDAKVINASDAHGSFRDLSKAIEEFVRRKTSGEHVYFNFSGDVSSGDVDEVVPCMEALAALQARFPNEVTIQPGNGDRRGTSLVLGLSREAATRFAPQLHQELEKRTDAALTQVQAELGTDSVKGTGMLKKFLYGAVLLKLARFGGTGALHPHEFNREFLAGLARGISEEAAGSRTVKEAIGLFGKAVEPLRPWERKQAEQYPPETLEQARKIFEYWKLSDKVLNEQPALAIYESPGAVLLATHSGYVGRGGKLGELAYNPPAIDQAVWNKLIHPEKGEKPGAAEKYGPYVSYTPEIQAALLEKILPADKAAALVVGHNHGNFTERLSVGGGPVLRVENCVSTHPKRAGENASFVEIRLEDLARKPDSPEQAVTFKKVG